MLSHADGASQVFGLTDPNLGANQGIGAASGFGDANAVGGGIYASPGSAAGVGTATALSPYVKYTAMPQVGGVTQGAWWGHPNPLGFKDNGGAGDLVTFGTPMSGAVGKVRVFTSQDSGYTWAPPASDAYAVKPSGWTPGDGDGLNSVCQDSTGAVHILLKLASGSLYYMRVTLTRDGSGHVTGYTTVTGFTSNIDVSTLTGPSVDVRGQIFIATTGTSVETLMLAIGCSGASNHQLVYLSKATSLTPTAVSNFTDLSGTASTMSLWMDGGAAAGGMYDHGFSIQQHPSSKDLYVFCGNLVTEPQTTTQLGVLWSRATVSGATWTAGATNHVLGASGVSANGCFFGGTDVTANYVWAGFMNYDTGTGQGPKFLKVDSSGTLTVAGPTSPTLASFTDQATCFLTFHVHSDETRISAAWARDSSVDTGHWGRFHLSAGQWNGVAWILQLSDTGTTHGVDASAQNFAYGLSKVAGWDGGLAAIITDCTGTSFSGGLVSLTLAATELVSSGSVGTSAGVGAASGVGAALAPAAGTSTGVGAATGTALALAPAAGTAAGVGSATGTALALAPAVGTSAGVGAASGVGGALAPAVGTAAGVGSASAVAGGSTLSADGTSAGVGTASGVGAAISQAFGFMFPPPIAVANGFGISTAAAVGTSAGVATVTGVSPSGSTVDAVGTAAGTSTVSGVGFGFSPAAGTAAGTGTATAVGVAAAQADGFALGQTGVTGFTAYAIAATGTAAGTSTAFSNNNVAVGTAAGVATVTAVGVQAWQADGFSLGQTGVTGFGTAAYTTTGTSAGVGAASGVGAAVFQGVGNSSGTGAATGAGNALVLSVGTSAGVATVTAVGFGFSPSVGTSAGLATVSGTARAVGAAAGTSAGTTNVTGFALATARSVGTAAGVGTALAYMLVPLPPIFVVPGTFYEPLVLSSGGSVQAKPSLAGVTPLVGKYVGIV